MTVNEVPITDKSAFDKLAPHPLQSWEWGDFRKKNGIEVVRLGRYENNKLLETALLTIHRLPFTDKTIGYLPKNNIPSALMLEKLLERGRHFNCIFIKLEPDVEKDQANLDDLIKVHPLSKSLHPLFTKYTFRLDLRKTEDELQKRLSSKTRYNIKIAKKHNVEIVEDNSLQAFSNYLALLFETTKRQKFYAHNKNYHELMWETMRKAGIAHLLTASCKINNKKETLVSWILFLFNDVLYYPYGASSSVNRNFMASNLMMWEAILFGKKHKAKSFDMWGSLGPEPSPKDPWYGFHRFKEGYAPSLIEFIGSYDLVISPNLYRLYNLSYKIREFYLKIKSVFN